MQVRVYGDAATKAQERTMAGEPALWLSNHRTRIDWMLLWSVALRAGALSSLRIVLKAPLRSLPVFGWAMQHFVFIFLVRPLVSRPAARRAVSPLRARLSSRPSPTSNGARRTTRATSSDCCRSWAAPSPRPPTCSSPRAPT